MKNNLKSVRLSDEILEIVQSYRGEGFNEKFENLVIDFKKSLPEHEAYKAALDENIKHQKEMLWALQAKIKKAEKIDSIISRCLSDLNQF